MSFNLSKDDAIKSINYNRNTDDIDFSNLKIYVTENVHFTASFENIFKSYMPTFTSDQEVSRWQKDQFKFWQVQLNFAVYCATSRCGISLNHFKNDEIPELETSVL